MRSPIIIHGRPVPKGRPRFTRSGHAYTPPKTNLFEKEVALAYRQSGFPMFDADAKLVLDIRFYFRIPKNTTQKQREEIENKSYYAKKPDIDNLCKAVMDGLNGVAYEDDKQVVVLDACKMYDKRGLGERTEIIIYKV